MQSGDCISSSKEFGMLNPVLTVHIVACVQYGLVVAGGVGLRIDGADGVLHDASDEIDFLVMSYVAVLR